MFKTIRMIFFNISNSFKIMLIKISLISKLMISKLQTQIMKITIYKNLIKIIYFKTFSLKRNNKKLIILKLSIKLRKHKINN